MRRKNKNICEKIVGFYFEELFNNKFPKVRDKRLRNPKTNRVLELDGYCKELGLAFEHNGTQHYKPDKYNDYNIDDIQYRDKIKKQLCKENNITLIVIRELLIYTKIDDLREEIKKQCDKNNFKLPKNYDDIVVNFDKFYIGLQENSKKKFKQIERFCNKNDIEIKCKTYISNGFEFDARCKICNKEWKATYSKFKKGQGCSFCAIKKGAKKRGYTYKFVKNFVEKEGYKLISKEYVSCKEHLLIKCKECNENWKVSFDNFKSGTRCPKCFDYTASKKRSKNPIEEIRKYCIEMGGECLENEYHGRERYRVSCDKGHIFNLYWKGAADTRRYKLWCKECKRELKLKEIEKFCKDNNCILLEKKYKGCNCKYNVKCGKGHKFILFWRGVKTTCGCWCKECKKENYGKNNNNDGNL